MIHSISINNRWIYHESPEPELDNYVFYTAYCGAYIPKEYKFPDINIHHLCANCEKSRKKLESGRGYFTSQGRKVEIQFIMRDIYENF